MKMRPKSMENTPEIQTSLNVFCATAPPKQIMKNFVLERNQFCGKYDMKDVILFQVLIKKVQNQKHTRIPSSDKT